MATILYKDGKSERFQAVDVQVQLENGWSVTDEATEVKPAIETLEVPEEIHPVRQAAKDAGIDGWENKRIKTLEEALDVVKN